MNCNISQIVLVLLQVDPLGHQLLRQCLLFVRLALIIYQKLVMHLEVRLFRHSMASVVDLIIAFQKAIIMDSPKIIMAIQLLLELGFLLHQIFTEMFQNPKPYLEHAIIYLTLHIE